MNENKSLIDKQPLPLQFFLFLFLMIGCSKLFEYISYMMVKPLFGIEGADSFLNNVVSNPESLKNNLNAINAFKFIQLLWTIGGFLLPALLFAWLKSPRKDFLKIKTVAPVLLFLFSALIIFLSTPLIDLVYEWNKTFDFTTLGAAGNELKNLEAKQESLTMIFLEMPSIKIFLLNIFILALIPAIAEELFFRGVLQQLIQQASKNIHVSVWFTAIIFSAFHFDITGFFPRMLLGALLGYAFAWSGSILVSMTGHFINNAAQVVLVYLYQSRTISYDAASDTPTPIYITVIFTVAMIGLLYFFYKRRIIVKEEIPARDSTFDSLTPTDNNG